MRGMSTGNPLIFVNFFFFGLERLDPEHLRVLFFILAFTPPFLEMVAVAFLAATVADGGWLSTISISLALSLRLLFLKKSGETTRSCSIHGIFALYLSALVVCIFHTRDIRQINTVSAPFILAAGSIILSRRNNGEDEFSWLGRSIRLSLRQTLHDLLLEIGGNVLEDEMLQLAILRWICDYWSTSSSVYANEIRGQKNNNATAPCCDMLVNKTGAQKSYSSTVFELPALHQSKNKPVQWNDMSQMLEMTTNQMHAEAPFSTYPLRQSHLPDEMPKKGYAESKMNSSIQSLRDMLASLDVDDRAKPAVQSYKRVIENIPPSYNVALLVALMRRCPSMLSLLVCILFTSCNFLHAAFTLCPLIILEVIRVREWAVSLKNASIEFDLNAFKTDQKARDDKNRALLPWLPSSNLDSVFIMLSSDQHPSKSSSLLRVWYNVLNSVRALESGLLAVRCAHTTIAATELSFNVVSLATLGAEVCNRGWSHVLNLVVRDVFHFVANTSCGEPMSFRSCCHGHYTAAALNAFKTVNILVPNMEVLRDEGWKEMGAAMRMCTSTLGRCWLGNENNFQCNHEGDQANQKECTNMIKTSSEDNIVMMPNVKGEVQNTKISTFVSNKTTGPTRTCAMPNFTEDHKILGGKVCNNANLVEKIPSTLCSIDNICASEMSSNDDQVKSNVTSTLTDAGSTMPELTKGLSNIAPSKLKLAADVQGKYDDKNKSVLANYDNNLIPGIALTPLSLDLSENIGTIKKISLDANVSEDTDALIDSEAFLLATKLRKEFSSTSSKHDAIGVIDENVIDEDEWAELDEVNPSGGHYLEKQVSRSTIAGAYCESGPNRMDLLLDNHPVASKCDENDKWIKWLGGGLVLVGAFVGGIVLANATEKSHAESDDKTAQSKCDMKNSTIKKQSPKR